MVTRTYKRDDLVIKVTGELESIRDFENEVKSFNLYSVADYTEEIPSEVTPDDIKKLKEDKEEFLYPRGDRRILKNMPKDNEESKASK